MPRFRTAFWLLVVLVPLGLTAGARGDMMSFHWRDGHSLYQSVTVEITSQGSTRVEVNYAGQHSTTELMLSPSEVTYFEAQFRKVLTLERQAVEVMAVDTGATTWKMTEGDQTRELSYVHTHDPWASDLSQAMWRFAERETALLKLRQDDPKRRYYAAYEVMSDLRQGRIFRPASLRDALLEAAARWPVAGRSPLYNRDTVANLLAALAYCEPAEEWAGDVMGLYASATPDARVTVLLAIANYNFLSDLEGERPRLLVPLMIGGLRETLADSSRATDAERWDACWEVIIALGWLRDARALELLASSDVWDPSPRDDLAGSAARALSQMGLAGVRTLVEKASSDDEQIRQIARAELVHSAQVYAFPSRFAPSPRGPDPKAVDEVRQFLVERGLGPGGADSFSLSAEAAQRLKSSYPGWRLMLTSEFSDGVVEVVRAPYPHRAGPQRCLGDFDGNGLEDIALLIRKDDAVKLVALRQSEEKRWIADDIATFGHPAGTDEGDGKFETYVTAATPRTVTFWPVSEEETSTRLELRNDGIEVRHEGDPGVIYYWHKGEQSAVTDE